MDFSEVIEQYILGKFSEENIPDAAAEALLEGLDSPSLRVLSVSQKAHPFEIKKLLMNSLDELKISMPTPRQAALSMARRIATDIVTGKIDPDTGAHQIWWKIWEDYRELDMLTPFVGLASEYDDHSERRGEYSQDIILYSQEFLSNIENDDTSVEKLDCKDA